MTSRNPVTVQSDALPDACFRAKLCFLKWAAALPRLLLATRTSFARFLRSTFAVASHHGDALPDTALFPLPVPVPGLFQRCDPKSPDGDPKAALHARLLNRVVRIVVMALNFLHADCRPIPVAALRRPPSSTQSKVLGRVRRMLEASSRFVDKFVVASGRRSAHLLARQEELRSFLEHCGLPATLYPGCPDAGSFVPHRGGPPELKPYRDADASRLAITGQGHWDITPFLSEELLMPFLEPAVPEMTPSLTPRVTARLRPLGFSSCGTPLAFSVFARVLETPMTFAVCSGPLRTAAATA